MKHNLADAIFDIIVLLAVRLKLILKDRTTVLVLLISIFVFAWMIQVLSVSANNQSAIPIGVVDYDHSDSSKKLIDNLKAVPTLRIVNQGEKELNKLLLDEMITSYFVIDQGYEQRLKQGDLDDILTMYYIKDNKSSAVISDIVAGEMMYSVCFYKGLNLYDRVPWDGNKHTAKEYESYMKKLISTSKDFNFAFHMVYINPKNAAQSDKLSNALIYNQLIFGILGILISFVCMFLLSGIVLEKEMGLSLRLTITKFHRLKRDIANLAAILLMGGGVAIIFTELIYIRLQVQDIKLWGSIFLLLIMDAFAMGVVFLLLGKVVKNIISYQLITTFVILITGGLGFYQLLTGFYKNITGNFIKIIPNNWFIQAFTDIILYGGAGGYIKTGHQMLLWTAAGGLLLIVLTDLPFKQIFHLSKKDLNRTV